MELLSISELQLEYWVQNATRIHYWCHYEDAIMSVIASQITSLTIVYPSVYSGTDQRKHQSSVSLAIARGIHRWPVNSPHKGPVTRKMFPFDDVIMTCSMNVSLMFKLFFLRIAGTNFHRATFSKLPCMNWIHRKDIPTLYTDKGLYKWLWVSIALDNDLVPIRWQAFAWNNDASACTDTNTRRQDTETKWTLFRRRHFQMHFLEWKCLITD